MIMHAERRLDHAAHDRALLAVWLTAKGREVVLTDQWICPKAHHGDIEVCFEHPHRRRLRWLGAPRAVDVVAVATPRRRMPRVKANWGDFGTKDVHGLAELVAERPAQRRNLYTLGNLAISVHERCCGHIDMDDLGSSVDPGVGAPGTDDPR